MIKELAKEKFFKLFLNSRQPLKNTDLNISKRHAYLESNTAMGCFRFHHISMKISQTVENVEFIKGEYIKKQYTRLLDVVYDMGNILILDENRQQIQMFRSKEDILRIV
jgi:DNA topoisomerase VI subunit A